MIDHNDLPPDWRQALAPFFTSDEYKKLYKELSQRHADGAIIFPSKENIFSAFDLTPIDSVKVVILGQDPYHGIGQAMGLSFSVPADLQPPPSLRNIIKEVDSDIGGSALTSPDLSPWARQGVLLLNSVLTVEEKSPGSHAKVGWEALTDLAIKVLSARQRGVVFFLWGAFAQKKVALIDKSKHLVLPSAHPSPLSAYRGFFGSRPFSQANDYLTAQGQPQIRW